MYSFATISAPFHLFACTAGSSRHSQYIQDSLIPVYFLTRYLSAQRLGVLPSAVRPGPRPPLKLSRPVSTFTRPTARPTRMGCNGVSNGSKCVCDTGVLGAPHPWQISTLTAWCGGPKSKWLLSATCHLDKKSINHEMQVVLEHINYFSDYVHDVGSRYHMWLQRDLRTGLACVPRE